MTISELIFSAALDCNASRSVIECIRLRPDCSFLVDRRVALLIEYRSGFFRLTCPAILARWLHDKTVIDSLMRSLKVIMIPECLAKDVPTLVPEYLKMIRAFLLNCLDESLDEGNRSRRSTGGTMRLDLGLLEHFQKWLLILAIVIAHH